MAQGHRVGGAFALFLPCWLSLFDVLIHTEDRQPLELCPPRLSRLIIRSACALDRALGPLQTIRADATLFVAARHFLSRDNIMRKLLPLLAIAMLATGCSTARLTDEDIRAAAESLDYGDSTSATLVNKAWRAADRKKYPAVFALTQRCVALYGEEGKRMNDEMTDFEPEATASEKWALNDVGTCLYIMATAYADLEMYRESADAWRRLADDYPYTQCWDPGGWYWRPAENAAFNAEYYEKQALPW